MTTEGTARDLGKDLDFVGDIRRDVVNALAWFDVADEVTRLRLEDLADFARAALDGWEVALMTVFGLQKAYDLLNKGFESACEQQDALKQKVRELETENTHLRAALAVSKDPCLYCQLPAAEMARCKSGFPGCARADDMTGCPEFGAALECYQLKEQVQLYEEAIRRHRDYRGDDRCYLDDRELYAVLPEGYTPPAQDVAVTLEQCQKFIACRSDPATEYVSPQRRIEELELENHKLQGECGHLQADVAELKAEIARLRGEALK